MRVLIVTSGSLGDVAPYTGLATRLQAAGHQVAIATEDRFAGWIRARGVECRPLGLDLDVMLATPDGAGDGGSHALGTERQELASDLTQVPGFIHQLGQALASVMQRSTDVDLVVLSTAATPIGWHVAEALDQPTIGAYVTPMHPTRAFPATFILRKTLGSWANRATTRAWLATIDQIYRRTTRELREHLGLPPLSSGVLRRRLERRRWPVLYGFSPTVVPRPPDWRPGLEVVGYWWPARPHGWEPPADLVDFLDAGPSPVFVGFGSLGSGRGEDLVDTALAALRKVGARGVVQAGGADHPVADDDVVTIGDVPYDWLMPRLAAVVHHGGAGTAAAGLRAGLPAVAIPLAVDTPFWATRLAALGVSPGVLRHKDVSVDALASALEQALTNPSHRQRARAVARSMEAEDGAGRAVELIERSLARSRPQSK